MYLLKKKTKEMRAATYLPDFPILKPREDRVKMRAHARHTLAERC